MKLGGYEKDENARCRARNGHPQALPSRRPLPLCANAAPSSPSVRGARRLRHSSSTIAAASARIVTKKKLVVLDHGPDNRHFAAAGGENLALGQFVQSRDRSLHHHDIRITVVIWKNCFRLTRIVPRTKLMPNRTASPDAEHSAERFEDAGCIEPYHAIEHENGLDALAENHQKYKEEYTPSCRCRG